MLVRWVLRHPVLTFAGGLWVALILFVVISDDDPNDSVGADVFAALILFGVGVGVLLLIGWPIDAWKNRVRKVGQSQRSTSTNAKAKPVESPVHSTPVQSTVPPIAVRHRSPLSRVDHEENASHLSGLSPNTRIEVINQLDPSERIQFALTGDEMSTVVATDERLLVVVRTGRGNAMGSASLPYESLDNVTFDPDRGGGRLFVHYEGVQRLILRVSTAWQRDEAVESIPAIRMLIVESKYVEDEDPSEPTESAFAETAHQEVPTAPIGATVSLGDMLTMTPSEFEEFTGKALQAIGYTNVSRVGGAGDLAADLTATDPQGRSVIVQCKRYTPGSRIGSPVLQSFIGMQAVHHQVDRGIFVTTADYSQQAIELAKTHDIVLIDGDDLVKIAALVLKPQGTAAAHGRRIYCPNCGVANMPGARFCNVCGAAITT